MRQTPRAGIVLALRALHSLLSVLFLSCLAYVYYAALRRRRDRRLAAAVAALVLEGVALMLNGGDCPLGRVHRRYGDDKPFFELLMPPRAARLAVPVLTGVTAVGFALVIARTPRGR